MAQVVTESIIITFSKLVKDSGTAETITDSEVLAALEQVSQELVGPSVIVEVTKA